MRPLIIAFLLGCLAIVPAFGAATSTPTARYQIEVLIFEVRLPELEGSELWTRVERPVDLIDAPMPADMPSSEDFVSAAEALRADGRFRVLLQKRWVQNAEPPKSDVPPMHLATWDAELDGTLRFYLSRFLHVELNLLFQPQTTVIGGDAAPNYLIKEERRIRSNQLHYFDHPKFGVLFRVSPAPA